MDLSNFELKLEYPCQWTYKIIGSVKEDLRQAVKEVIGDVDHTLTFSNNSKTGRYLSLRLVLVVQSEAQRVGIYQALSQHDAIKIVL